MVQDTGIPDRVLPRQSSHAICVDNRAASINSTQRNRYVQVLHEICDGARNGLHSLDKADRDLLVPARARRSSAWGSLGLGCRSDTHNRFSNERRRFQVGPGESIPPTVRRTGALALAMEYPGDFDSELDGPGRQIESCPAAKEGPSRWVSLAQHATTGIVTQKSPSANVLGS